MSTLKVNEMRHLSNTGTANLVLESNATTNLQVTSTLGLTVNGTLTVSGVSTFNGNVVVGNASTDTVLLTSTVSGSANYSGFTGEIRMYAGNAAGDDPPDGWLYCNGDTINQTTTGSPDHHNADGTGNDYEALYILLKASSDWGNSSSLTWGHVSGNVKVPDFRSRSPVGVHTGASSALPTGLTQRTLGDGTSIADGSTLVGKETHVMVTAEMPSHTHVAVPVASATGQTVSQTDHNHTMNFRSGGPDPNNTSTDGIHQHPQSHGSGGGSGSSSHFYIVGSAGAAAANTGTGTSGADNHNHNLSSHEHDVSGTSHMASTNAISLGGETHNHAVGINTAGSGNAHTILSPIIAVHYIIKV